ncbi:hypothetical protein TURU_049480 [Turdus rufiventris]|nr:hypothetical protein TURU_049480 [Turdus rufiventris]
MVGQSATDVNSIKTQCPVSALQIMLLARGLLGRTIPAGIVNGSDIRRLKLPTACPSAHVDWCHWKWNRFDVSSGRVLQKIHICNMVREDQEWLIQEF